MRNIKNDIVYASKKTLDLGLNCGSEGNLSVRRKDTIFITPSGIETTSLNESLISEVDITCMLILLFARASLSLYLGIDTIM